MKNGVEAFELHETLHVKDARKTQKFIGRRIGRIVEETCLKFVQLLRHECMNLIMFHIRHIRNMLVMNITNDNYRIVF